VLAPVSRAVAVSVESLRPYSNRARGPSRTNRAPFSSGLLAISGVYAVSNAAAPNGDIIDISNLVPIAGHHLPKNIPIGHLKRKEHRIQWPV